MRRLTAREAFSPTRSWTVDAGGRWRDGKGRFVKRERVLDRVKGAKSTDDISRMLRDASRLVPKGAGRDDYMVTVDYEGYGYRSLSHAEGLRGALRQAASELEGLPDRLQGYWRHGEGRGGRPGERLDPRIRGISIVRVKDSKPEKRKKRRKRRKS